MNKQDNNNLYLFLLKDNVNILMKIFKIKLEEKQENINELLEQFNENNEFLEKLNIKDNVSRETFEV